jgi:hypothetical protein
MILSYWNWYERSVGYDWVLPGDSTTQSEAVNQAIASTDHLADYSKPFDTYPNLVLDKSEPGNSPHVSNSLADFMSTSFSSRDNYYGWSWFSDVPKAFTAYLNSVSPGGFTIETSNVRLNDATLDWEIYKTWIDRGIPVMLLVDSNGDGETDHFIPGIGYDDTDPNIKRYAAYNTWDGAVHWYVWGPMVSGQMFGVYGATLLEIENPEFPTVTPVPTFTSTTTKVPSITATQPTWTSTKFPTMTTFTVTPTHIPTPKKGENAILIGLIITVVVLLGVLVYLFILLRKEMDKK